MYQNALDLFFFYSFLLIALFNLVKTKDKIVAGVSLLYASTQFFNFFYTPISWIDLCFESIVCLLLGLAILSQSVRVWSVSLSIILISSIALIFIEFVDYHLFNSYFEQTYITWINATTALEIIILIMASNGYLHNYAGGTNTIWNDIYNFIRYNVGKLSAKEAPG